MKRILLSLTGIFAVFLLSPALASASSSGESIIAGTITDGGSPVAGASVSVVCDGSTLTSPTTAAGAYEVTFTSTACPAGFTANVTATKGSASGSNSGTVNNLTNDPTTINLAIVNVSVPELGLFTGIGAAIIGGGAFLVIRRHNFVKN